MEHDDAPTTGHGQQPWAVTAGPGEPQSPIGGHGTPRSDAGPGTPGAAPGCAASTDADAKADANTNADADADADVDTHTHRTGSTGPADPHRRIATLERKLERKEHRLGAIITRYERLLAERNRRETTPAAEPTVTAAETEAEIDIDIETESTPAPRRNRSLLRRIADRLRGR